MFGRFQIPKYGIIPTGSYRNEAMCKAHDGIFGGHNAVHKTYLKISTSYFWAKMRQDFERHFKPPVSTTENINQQTYTSGTPSHSGTSKPPDSR